MKKLLVFISILFLTSCATRKTKPIQLNNNHYSDDNYYVGETSEMRYYFINGRNVNQYEAKRIMFEEWIRKKIIQLQIIKLGGVL